jgi:hypothetical protein
MNKKFDRLKQTLTSFKRSEFERAADSQEEEQPQQNSAADTSPPDTSLRQRTTLRLDKLRGVVSSQQPAPPSQPEAKQSPNEDTQAEQKEDHAEPLPQAAEGEHVPDPVEEKVSDVPGAVQPEGDNLPANEVPAEPEISLPEDSEKRSERSAALYAKTSLAPKKKQSESSTIQCNFRIERQLLEMFRKKCEDDGKSVSKVIRNMVKAYLGLCLVLFLSASAYPAGKDTSSTYSTEDIVSFLFSKAFGFTSIVPDAKTTFSARHSLWEMSERDSSGTVYLQDPSTRLELRLDIPILDISHYKDRSRQKRESHAFILKSLSRILAAQKTVNTLQNRIGVLNSRLSYLKNQVKLSLANKTDLFSIEDQILAAQSQLFDAQSSLEQRIIDLAIVAGNHWQEAYTMIIKWDGKLFPKQSEGATRD